MNEIKNPAPVSPGQVLAGKYRVERVLGVGGMGVVVAAHHLYLNERVALKFLLPEVVRNADIVARFSREAQAAVRIKSEHVARVSDVGSLENGSPYMVMEYLEGKDLESVLHERGPLPVLEAVEYVLQASEALAEAHSLGIVHRDLKPANLFLAMRADGSPLVKVLDFGISKLTGGAESQSMTRTTASMGSPLYMAPEQIRSAKSVDARVDLWALGVILFELLAARPPFMADSVPSLYVAIATEPPLSLRSVRPDVPATLEQVVLRCLEKDPARRFSDVGELALALQAFGPAHASMSVSRVQRTLRRSGADGSGRGSLPSIPGVSDVDPRSASGAAPGASTGPSITGPSITGPGTNPAMTAGEWARSNASRPSRGPRMGIVAAGIAATLALGAGGAVLALRGGGASAQATGELPTGAAAEGAPAGGETRPAASAAEVPVVATATAPASAGVEPPGAPPSASPSSAPEATKPAAAPRPAWKPTAAKPKPAPKPTAAPKPSASPFSGSRY